MLAAGIALVLSPVSIAPGTVAGFSPADMAFLSKKPATDPMMSFLRSASDERAWGREFSRHLSTEEVCDQVLCGDQTTNFEQICDDALCGDDVFTSDETCDIALCGDDDAEYEITVQFTIAATIEEFDASAQSAFKTALAAQLPGVSAADITLIISSASIQVTAVIARASTETLGFLQSLKESGTANLSAVLGVTITAMSNPSIAEVTGDTESAQTASIGGGIVAIVAVVGIVVIIGIAVAVAKMTKSSDGSFVVTVKEPEVKKHDVGAISATSAGVRTAE